MGIKNAESYAYFKFVDADLKKALKEVITKKICEI
jgi:hypothetical protein